MPRTAKPQRTDLNAKLPNKAMPSGQYGQGKQLHDSQAVVPMANPTMQVGLTQAASNPAPMPTAPSSVPPAGVGAPGPGPQPGSLTPLSAPSTMPHVPVTAGIATGPGPGPEAIPTMPQPKVSQLIARMAQLSGNPDLAFLAQHAQQSGQ